MVNEPESENPKSAQNSEEPALDGQVAGGGWPGWLFWTTCVVWLAADQASKHAALVWLRNAEPVVLVSGWLQLVFNTNTGAAFGILRGSPILPVVTILILLWMIWLSRSLNWWDMRAQVGAGLVLGGAVGNLIDRARFGHVIDFIDFFVAAWDWHYPTFNLADSGICVGLACVLWSEWSGGRKKA